MHIARMYAVELVEDLLQVLLLHTQTRIIDGEIQMMFIIPCLHRDKQRLFRFTILHGIVHQIEDHILKMHLIHIERGVYRLDIHVYLSTRMLYAEGERVGCILNYLVQVELLLLEHRLLAVEHTHLQYLFYQEAESLRFIIYHTTQMLLHLLALGNRWVVEHLCSQTDAGNRRLQLMGHIIDEIVLDLSISLLSEDDHDGEDEGDEQHQRENDARNHEAHTGEDVAVHIREVNLHDSHLRLRVVAEEHL